MKLIADSGSTKTDWVLLNGESKIFFKTAGFNPYFWTSEQISTELRPVFQENFDFGEIDEVVFYGAGCSSPAKVKVLEDAVKNILPSANVFVGHDMLAAARALLGKNPGIACILGTGSNSCLYDGNDIVENLFSLGFMFGDEGSGAHLGKTFIAAHLKKRTPKELQEAFKTKYSMSDEEILTNIYQKPNPNKFLASFTTFLNENIKYHYIENLVESCFDEFIEEQVSKYTDYKSYPLSCTGSIGFYLKDILVKSLYKHGLTPGKIIQSPIDGLVDYHSGVFS